MLSLYFLWPYLIKQIFKFLIFISIGLFSLTYIKHLSREKNEKGCNFLYNFSNNRFYLNIFRKTFRKIATKTISVATLTFWLVISWVNTKHTSKYIKTLVYLLIFTEII